MHAGKIALITGASAVGLFVVWRVAQNTVAAGAGGSAGSGGSLGAGGIVVGSSTGTGTSGSPPSNTTVGDIKALGSSTVGGVQLSTIGKIAAAPVYYPTAVVVDGAKKLVGWL